MKNISAWQNRRVVITKDCLSFAFVNHHEEVDRIPLSGIEYIKANEEIGAMDIEVESSHEHFCLQIATDPDGLNSGRSYYMRTSSQKTYDDLFPTLVKYTKAARKQAQASTLFQRVQVRVRKFYARFICQAIFAMIIIGVSAATCRQFFPLSFRAIQVFSRGPDFSAHRVSSAPSWSRSTQASSPTPTAPPPTSALSSTV